MKKSLLTIFGLIAGISLSAQVVFNVKTPAPVAGNYDLTYAISTNSWGVADLTDPANSVEGTLAFVSDGTAGDSLGCNALTNGAAVTGKIAVIYRGSCSFGTKALNAQNAGAIGIVIVNNTSGLINMLGGTEGMSVTVPTIFVSNETGALIKNDVNAGAVTAFIGDKAGLFPNDLGFKANLVAYPQFAARPAAISGAVNDYPVEPGLWVYNFGSAAQSGASASATITQTGGGTIYSETQSNLTLPSGDSVFISFTTFNPAWNVGEYTLTYNLSASGSDGDPSDNTTDAVFSINNTTYSFAPINFATGMPKANSFVRSTNPPPTFHCIAFVDPKASNLNLEGFSFAASAQTPRQLTNEYVEIEIYEWNDVFDSVGAATFDDLLAIANMDFTYEGNYTDSVIYVPYAGPAYTFISNQRYLACLKVLTDSINVGYTNHIDYDGNQSVYGQPMTPIKSGGNWFSGGFSNVTGAIGLHSSSNGSGIKDFTINSDVVPFPTPSNQYVNIPFATAGVKAATISVIDLNGKLVTSTTATADGKNLRVNTTNLSNGSYLFNVTLDNGTTSAFRVIVAR